MLLIRPTRRRRVPSSEPPSDDLSQAQSPGTCLTGTPAVRDREASRATARRWSHTTWARSQGPQVECSSNQPGQLPSFAKYRSTAHPTIEASIDTETRIVPEHRVTPLTKHLSHSTETSWTPCAATGRDFRRRSSSRDNRTLPRRSQPLAVMR